MPETSSLVSQFHLKINGSDAPDDLKQDFVEVTVENSLHMPDAATMIIYDPKLHWVDDSTLFPGNALEVQAAAISKGAVLKPVFDGEIVELESEYLASTHRLIVRAFDRLHRLSRGKRVRSFLNITDSDLAKKLAQEAGLQTDIVETRQVHRYLLQNNQTDLEFLRQRASAIGYLLYVQAKKLCFKPPVLSGQPVPLEWGSTLTEFRPRLTTVAQVKSVTARAWDPKEKQAIVSDAATGNGTRKIGHSKQNGADEFSGESKLLVSSVPLDSTNDANQLAKAIANRQSEQFIVAEGSCGGDPELVAGISISVGKVGTRFSGTYFVTSTSHSYKPKAGYITQFNISGQTPSTLLSLLRNDEPAANAGLAIGIVTDNNDPEGWGRVKVKYPWLCEDQSSDWVRLVSVGGGAERGIEFIPEVNDEVLVGFEHGDIHHPYVLGGLWNGKDAPPKKNSQIISSGRVEQRIIRSRTGHNIVFDDSDSNSSITIADKSGNSITLDATANKLTIDIKGDLTLKTPGKIDISGSQVDIKGTGQVGIKGGVIKLN